EFEALCENLGLASNDSNKVRTAFVNLDADGSGCVSLLEFLAFLFQERRQEAAFARLLQQRARRIYQQFIADSAEKQVNIRSSTQRRLKELLEDPDSPATPAPQHTPSPSPSSAASG